MRGDVDCRFGAWVRVFLPLILVVAARVSAQQSCAQFLPGDGMAEAVVDECSIDGVCQADGTCKTTPRLNGTPCDDRNPCTRNDRCAAGRCVGFPIVDGTACDDSFAALGSCLLDATCRSGECVASVKPCPSTDADACTIDRCDPATGECTTFTHTCGDQCSTAQCDPATGQCVNQQPANDGAACNTFLSCTSHERCDGGVCVGTPGPVCADGCGDCDQDGCTTTEEILRGVRAALEMRSIGECRLDLDLDRSIAVDEIIAALNALGQPCRATPTQTPTRTATPMLTLRSTPTRTPTAMLSPTETSVVVIPTATPTSTPTIDIGDASVASRALAAMHSTTSVLPVVADLLSALLGHVSPPATLTADLGAPVPVPFNCTGGGGGTVTCETDDAPDPPSRPTPVYSVQLDACTVSRAGGVAVRLDGTLSYTGDAGTDCGTVPAHGVLRVPSLTVNEIAASGSLTAHFTDFSAAIALSGENAACRYDAMRMDVTGAIAVALANPQGEPTISTQATFAAGAQIGIEVFQYGDSCLPANYSVGLSGAATFAGGGASLDGIFDRFSINNDTTAGNTRIAIDGEIASPCLGGRTYFRTRARHVSDAGLTCPYDGAEEIIHGPDFAISDILYYRATGTDFDFGGDGNIDGSIGSCHDPRLLTCVGS